MIVSVRAMAFAKVRAVVPGGAERTDSVRAGVHATPAEAQVVLVHDGAVGAVAGRSMFLDGGMLTGSAFMRQPWGVSKIYSITDPEYAGMRYIEPDKFYEIMKSATENVQIAPLVTVPAVLFSSMRQ